VRRSEIFAWWSERTGGDGAGRGDWRRHEWGRGGTLYGMSNSALYDRIAESFNRQRLLATLGARLARVGDGEVDIEGAS